ncbi:MAG: hypothetical protein HFF83_12010 [Oscillibacter sp.]|jgi:hypothetical protein|nr:hypothetical protein [Oscillibacter sp.]
MSKFFLRTPRQMNAGAIGTGLIFLAYLGASAMGWLAAADGIAILGSLVSLYVLASTAAGRRRDQKAISYSLLWGQTALTLLLLSCAVLAVRERLGLG